MSNLALCLACESELIPGKKCPKCGKSAYFVDPVPSGEQQEQKPS